MRKLVVSNIVSLDSYDEGPGTDVMVLPVDAAFDAYKRRAAARGGHPAAGRATLEGFKGFVALRCSGPDGPAGAARDLAAR